LWEQQNPQLISNPRPKRKNFGPARVDVEPSLIGCMNYFIPITVWSPFSLGPELCPKFYFILFLQQANLIGPSLQKNETMEAPQNRRFYFEV